MGARSCSGRPAAAALLVLVLVLVLLLVSAPAAAAARLRPGLDCSCGCSSRVVRMFTCGLDTPCCVTPCRRPPPTNGTLLASNPRTAPAVEAGRAAAPACTNATVTRDSQLERAHPVDIGTPEYHHGVGTDPVGVDGYTRSVTDYCLALSVANAVAAANNVSTKDVARHLLELRVNSSMANPWTVPPCNASARYRNLDGSCNNLGNPEWGQQGRPFVRLLCPRYADGVYEPPRALDGGPLPSARLLRRLLLPNAPFKYGDAHVYTLLTMQWGQLLAHDTALTRDFMGANGFSAQCCAINNSTPSHRSPLPANETASTCLPANGPGPYCLSIVRGNASFVTSDGFVGPGEQDNDVNSYIDASFVYGNSEATLVALRTNQSGLLATSGNNWLPPSANATVDCDPRNRSDVCFTAVKLERSRNVIFRVVVNKEVFQISSNVTTKKYFSSIVATIQFSKYNILNWEKIDVLLTFIHQSMIQSMVNNNRYITYAVYFITNYVGMV